MDVSAMQVALLAGAALCLLLLLTVCYRWWALVKEQCASRQEAFVPRHNRIAVISPTSSRQSTGTTRSDETGDEILYESAYQAMYQLPQQLPPYSIHPPPYEPPPVFPDEPPPSYASVAREERRKQRRLRIAASRISPSTNA